MTWLGVASDGDSQVSGFFYHISAVADAALRDVLLE
jgi:hypothetical protein